MLFLPFMVAVDKEKQLLLSGIVLHTAFLHSTMDNSWWGQKEPL